MSIIPSQLVIIGFGAVGKTLSAIMMKKKNSLNGIPILIIEPKDIADSAIYKKLCKKYKVKHVKDKITKLNYIELFDKHVKKNAIVIDVAWRIDSTSMVQLCQNKQCLYLNTALDDWDQANIHLIELEKRVVDGVKYKNNEPHMTALLDHGMNPGLVSHFVKHVLKTLADRSKDEKLIKLYKDNKYNYLAKALGLTLIQIAERDCQETDKLSTESEFYNTWSIIGLLDESTMNAEISWGTHEKQIPVDSDTSKLGDFCQIYMPLTGFQLRTTSYEPEGKALSGYCIPHAECYTIARYLQIKDKKDNTTYRPTVYYSYLIPDTAKLLCHYADYCLDDKGLPKNEHVLGSGEIKDGYDSVGCLLFFENGKRYWVGSVMHNTIAQKFNKEINVTCMQVGISILAAIEWMLQNPYEGIVDPEYVDTHFILSFCKDWLGKLFCVDVTADCGIKSDQFHEMVTFPDNINFEKFKFKNVENNIVEKKVEKKDEKKVEKK